MMLSWIMENAGTVLTALVVAGIAVGAAVSLHREKKAGRSSCGCSCANCTMSGTCHKSR